jgi:cyclopropane fatty-acyl-phospholipid synthase-like methyltransferase
MGYDDKYYRRHFTEYREWEKKIGAAIIKRFAAKSIIDFGCGCGSYLEGALEAGADRLVGIEINYKLAQPYIPKTLPGIREGDITQPFVGKFNIAMSVEAAEHIKPEGTAGFIDNLVKTAENAIVLTAAPPGQRGTGHINCRLQEFWIKEIEAGGFKYGKALTEECVKEWSSFNPAKWVLRNLMVFTKRTVESHQACPDG